MIETKDIILDKAKFSDWKEMYENVWSKPFSAKYMMWNVTTNEKDAQIRIEKTIHFQRTHDTYLVYEKISGKAIGFAGVEKVKEGVYQEVGICLGPDFSGKGYGKQILQALIDYSKKIGNAKEFIYSTREKNIASKRLAESFGFELISSELQIDQRDGSEYHYLKYSLKL